MRRILPLLLLASTPAAASAQAAWTTSGQVSTGIEQVENNTGSSKFSEYRDLDGTRVPLAFRLNAFSTSGWSLQAVGTDLTRTDRSIGLTLARPGGFRFDALWDELPHNLSNRAVTPYTTVAPGRLDVPQTMAIPFKKLATAAADAPGVVRSDTVAAQYARTFSKPTDLENLTRTGSAGMRYNGIRAVEISARYTRREKTGSHLSYGPIGDRPPRSLNIQLAEPLDYATGDFTVAAEYANTRFQLRGEYLLSQFDNDIDVLEWRNVWASAEPGAQFDAWDRTVATWGRRPLAPDNRYQSATFTGGLALPMESRLTATVARGTMEQDMELVPYAWQVDALANRALPRSTAQAKMNTTHLAAEYFIAPLPRINMRAFYRRFDLDNETPVSRWQGVTQDATNLNGTVSYLNKRQNEPIAWERSNFGLESTIRLPVMRSSLVLGLEREETDRERRQVAHMTENTYRVSWRARPTRWLTLRTAWLRGDRTADEYDYRSPAGSYWYEPAEASNDDPMNSFADHPDMRKYDLADRKRDRFDVTATVTPARNWSISTGYRYRRDDFDSSVTSVQPLAHLTTLADREARTPGDQLGLLLSKSSQLNLDVTFTPGDRLGLNASYGFDTGKSNMRSIEYNENNKKNPSTVNTAELGPWTRNGSQWTSDFDDQTRFAGIGGTFDLIPGRVAARASYTLSTSEMDIVYGGFGVTNFDGTPFPENHQFAFRTPEPVKQTWHTSVIGIDWRLSHRLEARIGWNFESYTIRDWQQETDHQTHESVFSELFLRDTSRSHQWGNRLFNMGSYLAPGFTGHAVHLGMTYQFGGRRPVL